MPRWTKTGDSMLAGGEERASRLDATQYVWVSCSVLQDKEIRMRIMMNENRIG